MFNECLDAGVFALEPKLVSWSSDEKAPLCEGPADDDEFLSRLSAPFSWLRTCLRKRCLRMWSRSVLFMLEAGTTLLSLHLTDVCATKRLKRKAAR